MQSLGTAGGTFAVPLLCAGLVAWLLLATPGHNPFVGDGLAPPPPALSAGSSGVDVALRPELSSPLVPRLVVRGWDPALPPLSPVPASPVLPLGLLSVLPLPLPRDTTTVPPTVVEPVRLPKSLPPTLRILWTTGLATPSRSAGNNAMLVGTMTLGAFLARLAMDLRGCASSCSDRVGWLSVAPGAFCASVSAPASAHRMPSAVLLCWRSLEASTPCCAVSGAVLAALPPRRKGRSMVWGCARVANASHHSPSTLPP